MSYDAKRIQTIGISLKVKDVKLGLNSENQDFVSNGNNIIGPEVVVSGQIHYLYTFNRMVNLMYDRIDIYIL